MPAIVKTTVERGLQAELTSHLGHEKGSELATMHATSRNGATSKKVESVLGPIGLDVPRDREARSLRSWAPRVRGASAGWTP